MSDELARPLIVLGCCVGWCVWCGVLSNLLEQPRLADHIATVLGCLVIAWALR